MSTVPWMDMDINGIIIIIDEFTKSQDVSELIWEYAKLSDICQQLKYAPKSTPKFINNVVFRLFDFSPDWLRDGVCGKFTCDCESTEYNDIYGNTYFDNHDTDSDNDKAHRRFALETIDECYISSKQHRRFTLETVDRCYILSHIYGYETKHYWCELEFDHYSGVKIKFEYHSVNCEIIVW